MATKNHGAFSKGLLKAVFSSKTQSEEDFKRKHWLNKVLVMLLVGFTGHFYINYFAESRQSTHD